jgi:hypothetical protein
VRVSPLVCLGCWPAGKRGGMSKSGPVGDEVRRLQGGAVLPQMAGIASEKQILSEWSISAAHGHTLSHDGGGYTARRRAPRNVLWKRQAWWSLGTHTQTHTHTHTYLYTRTAANHASHGGTDV